MVCLVIGSILLRLTVHLLCIFRLNCIFGHPLLPALDLVDRSVVTHIYSTGGKEIYQVRKTTFGVMPAVLIYSIICSTFSTAKYLFMPNLSVPSYICFRMCTGCWVIRKNLFLPSYIAILPMSVILLWCHKARWTAYGEPHFVFAFALTGKQHSSHHATEQILLILLQSCV